MSDNIESLTHNLDERQRALFLSALIEEHKDPWLAGLLTLTFGGLGAHRFYLGETTLGIIYACCFIPYFIVS
ncbi:MAG: TM2 domain-containing protein, partial [Rhodospirillales bacterium]|nr:TM2 domain-containing protein [Rhodospirillales bacterium]